MATLLNDNPDFFEVQAPDGQIQRVAKAGLSPDMSNFISSLPRPQEQLATNDAGPSLALASQAVSRQSAQTPGPATPQTFSAPPQPATDPALLSAIHSDPDTAHASPPQPGEATGPAPAAVPAHPSAQPSISDGGLSAAFGAQQRAARAGGEIEAKKADVLAQGAQQLSDLQQKFADQQTLQAAEQKKQLDEGMAKRQQAEDAEKKFQFRDYWADKGTGAKIMAAIATGLGAYSASINGGENQALKIIQGAIDRDSALQKSQYEKLKDQASQADTTYGRLVSRLKDDDLALKQTQITQLGAAQAKLQAMAAQYGSAEARNKADQIATQLGTLKAEKEQEYGYKLQELGAKQRQAQAAQNELLVPTVGQYAPSKEAAQKLNEEFTAINQSKSLVGHLQKLSNKSGGTLDPQTRAEAATVSDMLKGALKDELFKGRLNDRELDILNDVAVNPTKIFSLDATNKARLNAITKSLDMKGDAMLRTYGLRPQTSGGSGQPGYTRIQLPDGRIGAVPTEKVSVAISRGAKVVE